MGIYLNPTNEKFQRSLNSEIYVDKSELIAYTNSVLGTNQQYLCVMNQIREKDYPQSLQEYQGNILLVGVNYDKKTKKHECVIEKWEK